MNRMFGLIMAAGFIAAGTVLQMGELELPAASTKLVLAAFLLLAYLMSDVFTLVRVPRITGYILAGLVLGPGVTAVVTGEQIQELSMIDDLALAVIALAAGAELGFSELSGRSKELVLTLVLQGTVVPVVTGAVGYLGLSGLGLSSGSALAGALAVGGLALARSPASAMGVVAETRSKGGFTDLVMAVTIASDVLALLLFAALVSLAGGLAAESTTGTESFLVSTIVEIVLSAVIGAAVGFALTKYLDSAGQGLVVALLTMAFAVARLSRLITPWLEDFTGMALHLEPMLICLVSGLWVRNLSRHGHKLSDALTEGSLPIYVMFFAMAGASMDIDALKTMWVMALVLVAARAVGMWGSSFAAALVAGHDARRGNASGLSYLAQAGVSIGLCRMLAQRFPGWGSEVATLLIATIAINQVVGPAALSLALNIAGETAEARMKKAVGPQDIEQGRAG